MTNVTHLQEFVNVLGHPVAVDMKKMVLSGSPGAWCDHRQIKDRESGELRDWYLIKAPEYDGEPREYQFFIGSGATEECAWRDAHFRPGTA